MTLNLSQAGRPVTRDDARGHDEERGGVEGVEPRGRLGQQESRGQERPAGIYAGRRFVECFSPELATVELDPKEAPAVFRGMHASRVLRAC